MTLRSPFAQEYAFSHDKIIPSMIKHRCQIFFRAPCSGVPQAIGAAKTDSFSGKVSRFPFKHEKPLSPGLKISVPAPAGIPTERQPGDDYGTPPPGSPAPASSPPDAHPRPPIAPPLKGLRHDPPQAGTLTGPPGGGAGAHAGRGRGDLRARDTACRRPGR